jgi:hypothetical protein
MAKRKATAEELEAQAESNGYKRGAHREKDSTRDNGKHNKKTRRNQWPVALNDRIYLRLSILLIPVWNY